MYKGKCEYTVFASIITSNNLTDFTTYKPCLLASGCEVERNLALIALKTTSVDATLDQSKMNRNIMNTFRAAILKTFVKRTTGHHLEPCQVLYSLTILSSASTALLH
ncbi:Phage infection protein [Trichinella pseudospiralis]